MWKIRTKHLTWIMTSSLTCVTVSRLIIADLFWTFIANMDCGSDFEQTLKTCPKVPFAMVPKIWKKRNINVSLCVHLTRKQKVSVFYNFTVKWFSLTGLLCGNSGKNMALNLGKGHVARPSVIDWPLLVLEYGDWA